MAKPRPKANHSFAGKSKRWQLQEAKAKLSHLIELAQSQGDQTITRHGKPVAVLVSKKRHEKITGTADGRSFIEALLACPPGPELKIHRDREDRVPKGPALFEQFIMGYLLDTCAISEMVNKAPNHAAREGILALPREEIYLSIISVGEIQEGIEGLRECARKSFLRGWLDEHILTLYADRTFAVDVPIALRWGSLVANLRAIGKSMSATDSLIAATALLHDFVVVTRDEHDFKPSGVRILNPWK